MKIYLPWYWTEKIIVKQVLRSFFFNSKILFIEYKLNYLLLGIFLKYDTSEKRKDVWLTFLRQMMTGVRQDSMAKALLLITKSFQQHLTGPPDCHGIPSHCVNDGSKCTVFFLIVLCFFVLFCFLFFCFFFGGVVWWNRRCNIRVLIKEWHHISIPTVLVFRQIVQMSDDDP